MRRFVSCGLAVGWIAVVLVGGFLLTANPASAAATDGCIRALNDGKPGPALTPPVVLAPASGSAQRLVNFGTDRVTKTVSEVAFTSDRPLPPSVTPDQLNFDSALAQAGDTLESADFPDPTFSVPKISADRQTITFKICLNPGSIPAGKYVGTITLSGPAGLSAASMSLTVNAKTVTLFRIGAIMSLVAAFVLLVLKDATAGKGKEPLTWGRWLLKPLANPVWWATTVVSIGAAFGALYGIWNTNPAWGSAGFSDIAPLVAAAFAAVGGHTIISMLSPSPQLTAGPAAPPEQQPDASGSR